MLSAGCSPCEWGMSPLVFNSYTPVSQCLYPDFSGVFICWTRGTAHVRAPSSSFLCTCGQSLGHNLTARRLRAFWPRWELAQKWPGGLLSCYCGIQITRSGSDWGPSTSKALQIWCRQSRAERPALGPRAAVNPAASVSSGCWGDAVSSKQSSASAASAAAADFSCCSSSCGSLLRPDCTISCQLCHQQHQFTRWIFT